MCNMPTLQILSIYAQRGAQPVSMCGSGANFLISAHCSKCLQTELFLQNILFFSALGCTVTVGFGTVALYLGNTLESPGIL